MSHVYLLVAVILSIIISISIVTVISNPTPINSPSLFPMGLIKSMLVSLIGTIMGYTIGNNYFMACDDVEDKRLRKFATHNLVGVIMIVTIFIGIIIKFSVLNNL